MISSEIHPIYSTEKRPRLQSDAMVLEEADEKTLNVSMSPRSKTLLNGSIVDGIPLVDTSPTRNRENDHDDSSRSTRSTVTQEFYDAMDSDLVVTTPQKIEKRVGARCPVQGLYLSQTGDQMYAPYLQRPYPITDDVLAERSLLLSRQNIGSEMTILQYQLEIAQRFQKPKLFSDMKSFKAANPGAIFDDFIKWYGNPQDSISFLGIEFSSSSASTVTVDSRQKMIDKNWTFWLQTWDVADPVPAIEQDPLFDAESSVEVVLDYLENIHPSRLLCQVVAVNLSMSYFVLSASLGETVKVPLICDKVNQLYHVVEVALHQLAADATTSLDNIISHSLMQTGLMSDKVSSLSSITACVKACESIAAIEFIVSRAKSLLHKLPQQYELVQTILLHNNVSAVPIREEHSLTEILNTISNQQEQFVTLGPDIKVKPAIRQYTLQNVDDTAPCQLCVRTCDEGIKVLGPDQDEGCTLLALTKTIIES